MAKIQRIGLNPNQVNAAGRLSCQFFQQEIEFAADPILLETRFQAGYHDTTGAATHIHSVYDNQVSGLQAFDTAVVTVDQFIYSEDFNP